MTSFDRPRYYLTAEYPCSYLEGEKARSEVAVPGHFPALFGKLIRSGFRRSGHFVYRPGCRHCQACVAVRVIVPEFSPDRSQRRCLRRHSGLEIERLDPEFREEHFELYRRYQRARHPGGGMDEDDEAQYAKSLLQSPVPTSLYAFRQDRRLMMVSIVDEIPDGLSSVYTFFDPECAGLGTYNILWQIDLCRKRGIPHLYLGYWIASSRKMAYKINFMPLEGFLEGRWQPLERK